MLILTRARLKDCAHGGYKFEVPREINYDNSLDLLMLVPIYLFRFYLITGGIMYGF